MTYYINLQPSNPLTRIVAALLAVVALAGAVFFGLIILVVVAGAGLLLWLGLWVRLSWLRRKQGSSGPQESHQPTGDRQGDTIEAEYTVITRRRD
jgi:hypothetical protein